MSQLLDSPIVQRTLWVIALVIAALVASFLVPPLVALLREARGGLDILRQRITDWKARVVRSRLTEFWAARSAEPQEPVLVGLTRIDLAASELGVEQIRKLEQLDKKLVERMNLLKAAAAPKDVPSPNDWERIARTLAKGSAWSVIGLAGVALALGGINSALLSIFFREFIGSRPALPTLLPQVQIGHVLAVLFFVLEVASGWLIYRYGRPRNLQDGSHQGGIGAVRFFHTASWALLASLAIVELMAYAVLSDRLNLASQLRISPESPFYGFARFFFAAFGVAVTAGLAGIGHLMAGAIELFSHSRAERRVVGVLKHRDETVVRNVEKVRESVVAIRDAAAATSTTVARDFHARLGLSETYAGAPVALYAATIGVVTSVAPSSGSAIVAPGFKPPPPPPIRSRTQVIADLAVSLVLLAVLVIVAFLTASEVVTWLHAQASQLPKELLWAVGIAIPTAAAAIGVAARNAVAPARYATPVEQAVPAYHARRGFQIIAVSVALIAATLMALLTVQLGLLGDGALLNALLGVFQAGVLVVLGGMVAAGLVALIHASYLAWLGGAHLLAALLLGMGHVVTALLFVTEYVLRALAVPGDVVRSFAGKSPRHRVAPLAPHQQ